MGKVKRGPALFQVMVKNVVQRLFPRRTEPTKSSLLVQSFSRTKIAEVQKAGELLATGRAPGPDRMPPEIAKQVAKCCLKVIAKVMDQIGRVANLLSLGKKRF